MRRCFGTVRKKRRLFPYILPPLPLLLLLFLVGLSSQCVSSAAASGRRVSGLRFGRIQKHLAKINKPPILTVQSPDGDIIDCIHKRKQPAFDHPLLKNHKIQKDPPEFPRSSRPKSNDGHGKKTASSNNNSTYKGSGGEAAVKGAWQAWHANGTRCPKGTVPVRRSTVDDVLRAKSLYDYGRKRRPMMWPSGRPVDPPDVVSGNGHEHAIAYTGSSELYGAKATINVWDPWIEQGNEFSLSQMWVLSGSFDGSDLNSIEAGWQVSPELYGDSRPRLFTYWTESLVRPGFRWEVSIPSCGGDHSDSYQATGCYNLLCSGFVQTNSRIAIGAAISPVSSFSSNQFDITILIWKDPKLGNWWMGFGENTLVGYWPSELFTHLADHATMVEFGGEIVNSRAEDGAHTTTQMGSGRFSGDGFGHASYFRNLEVVDSDNSLSTVQAISTLAENTNCYDIRSSNDADWGTHFYYGGPGKNDQCP